jgi:hypothetical protein
VSWTALVRGEVENVGWCWLMLCNYVDWMLSTVGEAKSCQRGMIFRGLCR